MPLQYLLVYEDGHIVDCLPGTNEPFSLKRYHEESGIDYNHINLFLCTTEDHNKFDEDIARQLESHIEWESANNENCVTEGLPDALQVNEVIVMGGVNTELNNEDFEQQIIDDVLVT